MSIKIAKYDNSFLQVENYFNFLYSVKDMNLSSSFFVGFLSKIGRFKLDHVQLFPHLTHL